MKIHKLISASALIMLFAVAPIKAQKDECIPKKITFINTISPTELSENPLSVNIFDCNNQDTAEVNVSNGEHSYDNVGNMVIINRGTSKKPLGSQVFSNFADNSSITCESTSSESLICEIK